MKIDDKILQILSDAQSHDEWDIASNIFPWDDDKNRAKHGAYITVITKALWKLEASGKVAHFWVSHGEGVAGDRIWFMRGINRRDNP